MRIRELSDITHGQVDGSYDLAIFASGYESRASHVARLVGEGFAPARVVVLQFEENADHACRVVNDAAFDAVFPDNTKLVLSSNNLNQLYRHLESLRLGSGHIRMVLDYSSMPGVWYAGILNWLFLMDGIESITIDLVYSFGLHDSTVKRVEHEVIVRDVLPLPGCDGIQQPEKKTAVLFGLGFQPQLLMTAVERLEPSETYVFYAEPGAAPGYGELALEVNGGFLRHDVAAAKRIPLPLVSVENAWSVLAETCSYLSERYNVALVPVGPKTHVLACCLVSHQLPEIACIRVRSVAPAEDIRPAGPVSAARLVLVPGESAAANW